MPKIIKCPFCHGNAVMTYEENRVYQSKCISANCGQSMTVTSHSKVAAIELFTQFEKANAQLTIPKSIADELDAMTLIDFVDEIKDFDDLPYKLFDYVRPFGSEIKTGWYELFVIYLAGKALGVDLVKVV